MFDPRNLLKRLNRLIESFVPESWTQGGHEQRRPSPQEMRRLLLSEAKTISKLLDSAFSGHGSLLKELIEDLSKKPDGVLAERWDVVCQELLSVRRALYRLILARQSRSELLNEWNDWERHAQVSKGDKSLARFERQEMLASELRLRGIELPRATLLKMETESAPTPTASVEVSAVAVEAPLDQKEETVSLADDWEPMWLSQADEAADFWESVVTGADAPHLSAGQSMRLAKGFRMAQGNRKQADRVRGIRRYRLSAFGA
jgi:hypothetical protein